MKEKRKLKKWTMVENRLLFKLHFKIGNKWKKLAAYFKDKTDNSLKNNFFSIIRKALRTACKIIGKNSNTQFINRIKPRVLSEFIVKRDLFVDFKEFYENCGEEGKSNVCFLETNGFVNLNIFIKKFAFERFAVVYSACNKKDIFCLKKCLEYLIELDMKYNKKEIMMLKKI